MADKPWPVRVKKCRLCEVEAGLSPYGARGLCSPCYGFAHSRDILDRWPKIEDHKKAGDLVIQIARLIGCTEAAAQLGVETEEFKQWANGKIPRRWWAPLEALYARSLLQHDDPKREPLPCREPEERAVWRVFGATPMETEF